MLSNLLLLLICILSSSFILTTDSYNNKCLRHQEILLLKLKHELIFNSSLSTKLVRWNESGECCKWHGVECDASGYVVSLQLDGEAISGGIGELSSLFRFKYLQKLNLAFNYLDMNYPPILIPIPKSIGNLTYLTHLNLSHAGFGGQVPSEILSLTRLASLDISTGVLSLEKPDMDIPRLTSLKIPTAALSLEQPNLEMLFQNFTKLRELYLDWVNITSFRERKKWGHIISSYLPSLTSLSLVGCGLHGPLPKSFWQLHSLSILRLDRNNLSEVAVPDLFTNFPSLTTLTLSGCGLKGSIPSTFANLTKLTRVDLSLNLLKGSIPSTIANLTKLIHVDLSFNSLKGSIPSTFANLTKLIHLDLSANLLTGSLSPAIFEGLSNLVHLHLRFNFSSGNVPRSLFGLPSLVELDLRFNQFHGTFQLDNLRSLPNLTFLGLSSLPVDIGNVNSSSYGGLQLKVLHLLSCNLSQFPDFIKDLDLQVLDLAANGIAGEIPSWIWGTQLLFLGLPFNHLTNLQKPYHIPPSLESLYLHSNQLRGELHLPIPLESKLRELSLANNSISGSISTSICNARHLSILDLFRNKLSGSIPPCLFESIIIYLDLSRNNISGPIPYSFPLHCGLKYLDLNNNSLKGKIPKSLQNCKWLQLMNVGNNMMNDTFPCMLSSTLVVLVLHSNRFHGEVRCHMSWPNLQILDISSNHFSGSLESINFSSWTAMVLPSAEILTLGLSHHFSSSGLTLIMKGQMVKLYEICHTDDNGNGLTAREHDDLEEKGEIEWEYVCAAVGYVVGFGSIMWLLLLCQSFRERYFGKIEEVVEEMFIARDMRRRRARRAAARNRASRRQ
ncbi:xyloglucan:xyloglucosyl transferase [Salvia divinorum]|uniref:Xyloglucan:xyloglucosyl transferase n=1 Tax=Salvia divinorum TaxID=28513 RepID=A0ABD1GFC0_SALDI